MLMIPPLTPHSTTAQDYVARRQRLAQLLPPGTKVLFYSGELRSRNYPDNHYPFRASSYFLYFCGWNQPRCAAILEDGQCTVYHHQHGVEEAVWEGPGPDPEALRERFGYDKVASWNQLELPPDVLKVSPAAALMAGRPLDLDGLDAPLARAVLSLRLHNDPAAQRQLRQACQLTVEAHRAGHKAIAVGLNEEAVKAAMLEVVARDGGTTSFLPIISIHGETLHNPYCGLTMGPQDMLLVDFGAENGECWAGDVTRTHPVSGQMSPRQAEIYAAVLDANQKAIAGCRPGVEFRALHDLASLTLTQHLVSLGLLKGDPADLVARGAHTLFFPHGLGHLMGLDVHDMEDLGDRAGYAPGRRRSEQFGTCYLRLDRPLHEAMALTIEPGFYWIPALLENPERTGPYKDCLNLEVVQAYREVRGIRIEDDVLVTADGAEVLTADLPK